MDEIILFRIQYLQARVVKDSGFSFKRRGRDMVTGTVTAVLDEAAGPLTNFGLLNAKSGSIYLRWSVVVTLPVLADALAAGELAERESAPVRVAFEESGKVLDDGSGFDATGNGTVAPGSLLSQVVIFPHTNYVRVAPSDRGRPPDLSKALAKGKSVRCVLLPESSLEAQLPKSLGGGKHRLNLLGGFTLVPESMQRRGKRR